jgi:hypothetical protein
VEKAVGTVFASRKQPMHKLGFDLYELFLRPRASKWANGAGGIEIRIRIEGIRIDASRAISTTEGVLGIITMKR